MTPGGLVRENLRLARFGRSEIAGSLGDLGTFLPLLVGMAAASNLDFASALFFAGVASVLTGLLFPVPMAVQPMKAIAAVALTEGLSAEQIVAAGATVGAVMLLLGLSGWIVAIERLIPRSVVRGIQLGLGVALALKGLEFVQATGVLLAPDSYVTGAVALAIVVVMASSRRMPAALVLFGAGLVLAVWSDREVLGSLSFGLWVPALAPPGIDAFRDSFVPAALPQLPLTTLNSVVALCALSLHLFPERPIGVRRVATSVGVMNLVGMWIGAMPLCHGAGGLAAQHRFGARTNGAILFIGAAKVVLALAFGASLMALCEGFPRSVLGVMLAGAGYTLACAARDQRGWGLLPMFATAIAIVATGNSALALVVGLIVALPTRRSETANARDASRGGRPSSSDR